MPNRTQRKYAGRHDDMRIAIFVGSHGDAFGSHDGAQDKFETHDQREAP
ncbi:MAG TPA: hypothetical protein GX000_05385 [Actinomyces sp.]|nr:hypothetical protein [Acidobacteriota bacterium]HHT41052.1 hypothetical protein [Actinomyces sp.]